ncbi:MAG TPA: PaaI family thioesterase [Candidatus Binatia bacterium]|nr:PaaI family thioesterase [Candidatus Binatia bacterium]
MDRVIYDGSCFGCGQRNEDGLRMRFEPGTDESWCEYEVPERFQSWQGVVHGGVVALMLDEAVGWAGWHAGHPGVTGRLEVRYRRPLRVGERVRVAARLDRRRRGAVYASATIDRLHDAARIAEASATLMEVTAEITAAPD